MFGRSRLRARPPSSDCRRSWHQDRGSRHCRAGLRASWLVKALMSGARWWQPLEESRLRERADGHRIVMPEPRPFVLCRGQAPRTPRGSRRSAQGSIFLRSAAALVALQLADRGDLQMKLRTQGRRAREGRRARQDVLMDFGRPLPRHDPAASQGMMKVRGGRGALTKTDGHRGNVVGQTPLYQIRFTSCRQLDPSVA